MITEKLRRVFPGISALFAAIIGAVRAIHAYNRALKHMEALKIKDPCNAWIWEVAHHSMLPYSEALSIYEYLAEHPSVRKHTRNMITEFVIDMANCGHTADMILRYLEQIDMELDT